MRVQIFKCFFLSLHSLLYVESADRPGLLVDLVKNITDINVAVESGEFDTEVTIFSMLNLQAFHGNYKFLCPDCRVCWLRLNFMLATEIKPSLNLFNRSVNIYITGYNSIFCRSPKLIKYLCPNFYRLYQIVYDTS